MKDNSILNKVRQLLGLEVKLEQRKLDDSTTTVEAESFEKGEEIMIVTEDEQKIALPVGEYKMQSGEILVVKEEGIIEEVKAEEKEEDEEVIEEDSKKEDEKYEEKEEEMSAEDSKPIKKTVESIVKETFFSEMEALKKENKELKSQLQELSKEEVKETESETITEEVKEEVELSTEEPKAEEVEAAAEPIVHNPENKAKKVGNTISPNKRRTIMDTVLSKIANSNTNNN
tara:strand:- start:1657 stop:2346 length:690 start_codon:yes stop_codon:yes gene_type:complete